MQKAALQQTRHSLSQSLQDLQLRLLASEVAYDMKHHYILLIYTLACAPFSEHSAYTAADHV